MKLSAAQTELIVRTVLAIVESGRRPTPEDLNGCFAPSDEMLGLGALLETGAETVGAILSKDEWRAKRSAAPEQQQVRPGGQQPR